MLQARRRTESVPVRKDKGLVLDHPCFEKSSFDICVGSSLLSASQLRSWWLDFEIRWAELANTLSFKQIHIMSLILK